MLSTSRLPSKRNRVIARRRFGGIDLYSYGDQELDVEIESIRSDILSVVKESGPLVPSLARYLVAERSGREVSKRAFSALLGAELRCGRLDGILCESDTRKPFRVVIEASTKPFFGQLLLNCLDLIPSSGTLAVSTIRDRFYDGEKKGNWTRAYYLASRLARIGLVDFVDRFNIERAKDAYNAINQIDNPLYSFDIMRLD